MIHRQTRAVDPRTVGRLLVRGTLRAALTLIGITLVAIGLAGLLLPVLPGWVLIIAGFAILSREYAWARSGLVFARRYAARSSEKVRSLTARRRRQPADGSRASGAIVIDLPETPDDTGERKQGFISS